MLELHAYCIEKAPHLSMPVTGLMMLEAQGRLRLSIEIDPQNRRRLPYVPLLDVQGAGKRIVFDLADGYGSEVEHALPELVGRADFVFRRSFSPKENVKLPLELQGRMRPLGFHFHVSCPQNPIDTVSSWPEWRKSAFQRIFNGAPRSHFTLDKFERTPNRTEKPTILFYTRLWHVPQDDELYNSVEQMNQDRIHLVAELRSRYGSRFTGGIQFDPKEFRRWGHLMAGIGETKRMRYLQAMHRADICIGSIGLNDSIGWKTAEYVAAAKAVVNEKFCYEVPGDFREGVNYLPFDDVEGCLAQVEQLMEAPQRVYEMKMANYMYYQAYGRPDRMMANALRQVFPAWERSVAGT